MSETTWVGPVPFRQVQTGVFSGIFDPLASNPLKAGLFKFNDIFGNGAGQVPAGQKITSVTLRLFLQTDIITPGVKTIYVHPLLVDVPNFGTQDNAEETGAVSYSQLALDVTDWGVVVGPAVRDVDYDSTKAVGTTYDALSGFMHDVDLDLTAIVDEWYRGVSPNLGVYLMPGAAGEGEFFRSSENAVIADRPELIIEFEPAVLSADFNGDNVTDGADFLVWQRGSGTIYDATNLANWENEYGSTALPLAGTSAVPEPTALVLAVGGFLAIGFVGGRRNRGGATA